LCGASYYFLIPDSFLIPFLSFPFLSKMSAIAFRAPSPYPELLIKHTRAEQTAAAKCRNAHLLAYRASGITIPNDGNWDQFDGPKQNYRAARQALNAYLYKIGSPWRGTFSGVVAYVNTEHFQSK